jgi:hypothetical protein
MKTCGVVLISTAALLLPSEGRADVLPAWIIRRDQLKIRIGFENLNKYPQYDFYVKFGVGSQGSPEWARVNPENTATIFSWGRPRMGTVLLMAAPRGHEMTGHLEIRDKRDWLTKKLPGTLQSQALDGPEGPLGDEHNNWELTYRVHIDGDNLKVELVDSKPPPFRFSLGMACAGFAVSAGLAVVVIVMLRRSRRNAPSTE